MNATHGVLGRIVIWANMIKVPHSVFVLPFALIATFLAGRDLPGHTPLPSQVIMIVLCMVFARCVAMTYNRLVDMAIDTANPRTAQRDLPTGRITPLAAMFFLGISVGAFVATCMGFWWFHANPWPAILAVPVLIALCGYSHTKRFTEWSHLVLGGVEGLSPAAAWVAISPATLGWPAVVLGAAVAMWIGGFDIIYACQDVAFDRKFGLFSLPASWGIAKALWLTRLLHVATVGLLVAMAPLAGLGHVYLAGVIVVAALLLIENLMVKATDLSRVNVAFFTVNGFVAMLLGIAAIADILLDVLG